MSRIPYIWLLEIAAGTEFGKRAEAAIARMDLSGTLPTEKKKPQPDASTIGSKLRSVIETEIGRKLSCADCLGYLRKLNKQSSHDTAEIVQYLYANFPWPIEWRQKHGTPNLRRASILKIVESVIVTADPDK